MPAKKEIKAVFVAISALFALFLAMPVARLLSKSFSVEGGFGWDNYRNILTSAGFLEALRGSVAISAASAAVAVLLAFLLAYAVHYSGLPKLLKRFIAAATVLPMLLPTITYGFAIIYSLGKQGLLTRLLGFQPFDIYGFGGLLLGYVVYTLPIAFLLLSNTMRYIDKRFITVSRLMGDRPFRTFWVTTVRPMVGALGAAFVQAFFLCFTDYGIPASVGGQYKVVATELYNQMLGSLPSFENGAVIAMMMLLPSIASIVLLQVLEKYNFRYNQVSDLTPRKNILRDVLLGTGSLAVLLTVFSLFLVIFLVPFVKMWPYQLTFTTEHLTAIFRSPELSRVYTNSLLVAVLTAVLGSLIAYGAALVTTRSALPARLKGVLDAAALVINTIPGMVLGIAFLFAFTGTPLHNSIAIVVICNIIHFFSTPYLLMKNSLSKLSPSWETTAMLMGDSWLKTIVRVVTPNAGAALLEMFEYYFINAMVTVSAVIFLCGARTMVITAKIKELQYMAKFDQIFALSLLILATNLVAKGLCRLLARKKSKAGAFALLINKLQSMKKEKSSHAAL